MNSTRHSPSLFVWVTLFLFVLFPYPTYSLDQLVRVHVLSQYSLSEVQIIGSLAKLKLSENAEAETRWPPHLSLSVHAEEKQLNIRIGNSSQAAGQIVVEPPRGTFLTLKSSGGFERKFIGKLIIHSVKGELFFIEELWLEEYLMGVLKKEILAQFPTEVLKAQAVLARTQVLGHLDHHQKEGFNFCDQAHCQIYSGVFPIDRRLKEAIEKTKSIILTDQFKPIEVFYHSTCGGHTSPNQKVFAEKPISYLQGVSDDSFCAASPDTKWENSIPLNILEEVLKKDPQTNPRGSIQNIKIIDQEEKGRAFTLMIEGKKKVKVPALTFVSVVQKYLGRGVLKSNWFEVKIENEEAHFYGRGEGHGVGLCQWGAKGMAESGKKFDEILFHYFPGTNLVER